jgi:hypothetical protein
MLFVYTNQYHKSLWCLSCFLSVFVFYAKFYSLCISALRIFLSASLLLLFVFLLIVLFLFSLISVIHAIYILLS